MTADSLPPGATGPLPGDQEPRYTLAEAARVLARQECDTEGHDLDQHFTRTLGGVVVYLLTCTRCGARFQEVTDSPNQLVPLIVETTDAQLRVVNPEVLNGAGVIVRHRGSAR